MFTIEAENKTLQLLIDDIYCKCGVEISHINSILIAKKLIELGWRLQEENRNGIEQFH